jgi:hypothetical protein
MACDHRASGHPWPATIAGGCRRRGSNPAPGCFVGRGPDGGCRVTWDSRSPDVTARAHQGPAVPGAMRTQHGPARLYPYHSCCRAPVVEGAEVKRSGVSVADRGKPQASCPEWHGDGTAGEDDRASHLAAVAPARPMGEARPWRHEPGWQASIWRRGSTRLHPQLGSLRVRRWSVC